MGNLKTINVMLDDGVAEIYANDENQLPARAHEDDAGIDLRCPVGGTVIAHGTHFFDTGVHVEIPSGYVGFLKSKSGLMKKHGLTTEEVIDAGYSNSIGVVVINHSDKAYVFHKGDKLTQLVLLPIETPKPVLVDHFAESERGDDGFGSTGL